MIIKVSNIYPGVKAKGFYLILHSISLTTISLTSLKSLSILLRLKAKMN